MISLRVLKGERGSKLLINFRKVVNYMFNKVPKNNMDLQDAILELKDVIVKKRLYMAGSHFKINKDVTFYCSYGLDYFSINIDNRSLSMTIYSNTNVNVAFKLSRFDFNTLGKVIHSTISDIKKLSNKEQAGLDKRKKQYMKDEIKRLQQELKKI